MQTSKNIFYNVLLAISQVLFPLVTFPYLARTLGPEHIGLINFSESFAKYFVVLAALGIPVYGVREIAKFANSKLERSNLFLEIFGINLLCTIFFSLIFYACILIFPALQEHITLFKWALLYFVLQIFNLEWFFSGLGEFKFIALRSFFIRLLFILFVFIFIQSKWDYLKYMQMQVALSFILGVINFIRISKLINFNQQIFSQLNFKKHLKPLFYLFLTIFSISVYFSFDTILLGFLSDNESVGYYSTALKLNRLVIAVLSAISAAMFPSIMNYFQNNNLDKFNELIKDCFFLLVSLSLPIVVIFMGCAPEIIEILFGNNFTRAIVPLQITTPLICIVSMSTIFGFQVLSALGKDKQILYAALYGMSISIVLSLLLVPAFKEIGTSMSALITELVVCMAFIYYSFKYYPMPALFPIFLQQIKQLFPYLIILIIGKYLIGFIMLRMVFIVLLSFLWFSFYHLYINTDNFYAKQLYKYFPLT
jgi:O-antigen/teichoic acid export membrane protein